MEPYYTEAENPLSVHGNRGEDRDRTVGPVPPYRYPAVSHDPHPTTWRKHFERAGLKPFHVPLGFMIDEKNSANQGPAFVAHLVTVIVPDQSKADAQVVCVTSGAETRERCC